MPPNQTPTGQVELQFGCLPSMFCSGISQMCSVTSFNLAPCAILSDNPPRVDRNSVPSFCYLSEVVAVIQAPAVPPDFYPCQLNKTSSQSLRKLRGAALHFALEFRVSAAKFVNHDNIFDQ